MTQPILDDDLGEIDIQVKIFNCPKDQSQIMSIWKWPFSRTILDGHYLLSFLVTYDEHHVLKEDEKGVVGVKKKLHFFEKKTKGIKT